MSNCMEIQKKAEELNLDSSYISYLLSDSQNNEILDGLQKGLDVSVFAHRWYSFKHMKYIKECMTLGLDYTHLLMEEYDDIDFLTIEYIYHGLKKGLDVSLFTNREFSNLQAFEIYKGLDEGLDASIYAKKVYTPGQMREIRYGLQDNLDIELYLHPSIDVKEMMEIRSELSYLKEEEDHENLKNTIYIYEDGDLKTSLRDSSEN